MICAISMHRCHWRRRPWGGSTLRWVRGYTYDYTRTHTHAGAHIHSIPRRVEHEITRNEMTHPPRIISRKRLIKVRGSTMRTNKTRSALTHRHARVRTHDRLCWNTCVSRCIRCFSPRSSFFPPPPAPHRLSCRRRGRDAPQKRRARPNDM